MNNANWILKHNTQTIPCTSFPYAFRIMYNIMAKNLPNTELSLQGPKNPRGDRTKYSYAAASSLAKAQGLLQADGNLNAREYKKK